jgi:hypothetical protein
METAFVNCENCDAALQYVKLLQKPVKYHSQDWQFPLEADGVANVVLSYANPVQDLVISLTSATEKVVWSWKAKNPSTTLSLPFFSNTYPYLACVLPKFTVQFDPAPTSIAYDGICYPSQIVYRLLAGQHIYPLTGTLQSLKYAMNQVKLCDPTSRDKCKQ